MTATFSSFDLVWASVSSVGLVVSGEIVVGSDVMPLGWVFSLVVSTAWRLDREPLTRGRG